MDERIRQVVSGTTPAAREALVNLLTEALNVWMNLDVAGECDARCKRHVDLTGIRRLHQALLEASNTSHVGAENPHG